MKDCELTGSELDAAVLECLRDPVSGNAFLSGNGCFSSDWASGGPIIESEGICLVKRTDSEVAGERDEWRATYMISVGAYFGEGDFGNAFVAGPTPLIAAMRAFVTSKRAAALATQGLTE